MSAQYLRMLVIPTGTKPRQDTKKQESCAYFCGRIVFIIGIILYWTHYKKSHWRSTSIALIPNFTAYRYFTYKMRWIHRIIGKYLRFTKFWKSNVTLVVFGSAVC